MSSTCRFCRSNLGTNRSIGHFPIGRRVAFDVTRSRLWAVCPLCERWNPAPIAGRQAAIEECDRAFRSARVRSSTDNIVLARTDDGLALVRIGAASQLEMARWRYGDQFGRRRRRHAISAGVAVAVTAGFVVLGPALGVVAGGGLGLWGVAGITNNVYQTRRPRVYLKLPDREKPVALSLQQGYRVRLVRADDGWALGVFSTVLTGPDALAAVSVVLPAINGNGATRSEIDLAVRIVEELPDPASLFARYAGTAVPVSPLFPDGGTGHLLMNLPKEARLALEMASHEELERRAEDVASVAP